MERKELVNKRERLEVEINKMQQELLRVRIELGELQTGCNRERIIINDKMFDLYSSDGQVWFLDKEGAEDFGIYVGMVLDKWADIDFLNQIKANQRTEIKSVEIINNLK